MIERLSIPRDLATVLLEPKNELHNLAGNMLCGVVGATLPVPESEAPLDPAELVRMMSVQAGQIDAVQQDRDRSLRAGGVGVDVVPVQAGRVLDDLRDLLVRDGV